MQEKNVLDPVTKMDRKNRRPLAFAAMIIGIASLGAWLLPICGLPISILGLLFGFLARASSRRNMALAGIVMCGLGFVLGIANAVLGLIFLINL